MATPEITQMNPAELTETRVYKSAAEFEHAAVRAASQDTLVLCATARLARRLLHRCRQAHLSEGLIGWETPTIRSFHGWIRETYKSLWTTRQPLTPALALNLWHAAIQDVSVPDDLIVQPALYIHLQSSLEALQASGLNPVASAAEHQLANFRREATIRFLKLTEREGIALWRDVIVTVSTAVAAGRVALPRHIILAGFCHATPLEQNLCGSLVKQARVAHWRPEIELPPTARIRLYATPEQECSAICAEVLRAWNNGVKNLAVVFADRAWFPLLKRCFDDLAGQERPDFEQAIRYNMTVGTPLVDHPLFQTAIIPLLLPNSPNPAPLMSSLLGSPYVQALDSQAAKNLRATLWKPDRIVMLNELFVALSEYGYRMTSFQQLISKETAPLGDWLTMTEKCLDSLGFCRFDGQHRATDALARQYLNSVIRELNHANGAVVMNASTAIAWLTEASASIIVAEKTPETAGIQILNPSEALGLAFDHLWVVGAHGAVLPPPARDWPFLDPNEQKLLDGSSIEGQWEQGKRLLAILMAAAPKVDISRAASRDEDTPYSPCPLIPDETDTLGKPIQVTCNPWQNPTEEWMRARWLRDAWFALMHPDTINTAITSNPAISPIAGEHGVTAIGDLAACPFNFFAGRVLKLEPLATAEAGIDPRIRGSMLHNILKTFADGLASNAPDWPACENGALAWLERVVDNELKHYPDNVFWQVERLRLLGDAGTPGILPTWLDQEQERAQLGWQFALTEAPFKGLEVGGIIMRGRVDRIDRHEREGFIVWDYKSGAIPSATSVIEQATELQLPAYLLALQRGLVSDIQARTGTLQAGYINLQKAAEVAVKPLAIRSKNINWPEVLPQWETALTRRLEAPLQGYYAPDPRPGTPIIFHARKGACEFCEYYNLCGYFDRQPRQNDNEDDSQ